MQRTVGLSLLLALAMGIAPFLVYAQPVTLTGRVLEAETERPLPGAHVLLLALPDTSHHWGTVTDTTGRFTLRLPHPGKYRLRISFVGYHTLSEILDLSPTRQVRDLGTRYLRPLPVALQPVVVQAIQERVQIKGDTVEYQAEAFKVTPGATAEALVSKMPGIVIQNGTVQAQGETVQRILVDGEEFFGGDPLTVLRNLPAEMIARIQVFDRLSDQAQFTGFADQNTERTINLITRPQYRTGQFGRLYGGLGTDEATGAGRYQLGGVINLFNGTRRISLIGQTNNVNQQNFSIEDLLGVIGAAANRRGGPTMRLRGGPIRGNPPPNPPGGLLGGSELTQFLIGEQEGINAITAFGLHYNDRPSDRWRLSGSYFFNRTDNATQRQRDRTYLLADDSQLYQETNQAQSRNDNHRFNLRATYTIDERNDLILTPRLSIQNHRATSLLTGLSTLQGAALQNQTRNDYHTDYLGYNGSLGVLFRHRFATPHRTFSVQLNVQGGQRNGTRTQEAWSGVWMLPTDSLLTATTDRQDQDDARRNRTLGARLTYTEPLGHTGMLQFSYEPTHARSVSDRLTYRPNDIDAFTQLDSTLSSRFRQTTITHEAGLAYQYRSGASRLTIGLDYHQERLQGHQDLPSPLYTTRVFHSLLPSLRFQFRASVQQQLNLELRTFARTPSIEQLQDFIDTENPLQLSGGNPELRPSYRYLLLGRYHQTDATGGRLFMTMLALMLEPHYIGSATLVATRDTLLRGSVWLPAGGQFSYPVNLEGYWSARAFTTYSVPSPLLPGTLNLNLLFSYTCTPTRLNQRTAYNRTLTAGGGLLFGSNVSEQLDLTLGYWLDYTRAIYSFQDNTPQHYLQHRGNLRLSWLPTRWLLLENSMNLLGYHQPDTVSETVVLWNVGLGVRFLKNQTAELKLSVNDLLNQNRSLARTVTELYIERTDAQTLGRYLMLTLTYHVRRFPGRPSG